MKGKIWNLNRISIVRLIVFRFGICRNPAGNATDGSLTVYADDVAKVVLLQDAGQYRSATASTAIAYLTASEKPLHDC